MSLKIPNLGLTCNEEPPPKPPGGRWTWTDEYNFGSLVTYTCGLYKEFIDEVTQENIANITTECLWTQKWSISNHY